MLLVIMIASISRAFPRGAAGVLCFSMVLNAIFKVAWGSGGGGAHCAPPVTYLRITVQIHVRALRKNLTFPNYEFGIGHYAFYPMKLSRFAKKNKVHQK